MTNLVKQAGITNEGMIPGIPITTQGKAQKVAYFDGLGRPLQTVNTQASEAGKDIIATMVYDSFGRQVKKYLPFVDISTTSNYGAFKNT